MRIFISKKELVYQYITLNKSLNECSIHFDCSGTTIERRLKEYNIKKPNEMINNKRKEKNKQNKRIIKNISKKELTYQYITLNKTKKECKEYFKCSESTIDRRIKKYGLKKNTSNIIKSREKTFLRKYGYKSPGEVPDIKKKIKKTNLKKYGVEWGFESTIVQKKIKETNMKRYGNNNPSKNKKVQEKIKLTNKKKYGVYSHNQKNIIDYNVWINLDYFKKWIISNSKNKKRKTLYKDISEHFNVNLSNVSKKIHKLEKEDLEFVNRYILKNPLSLLEETISDWLIKNKILFHKHDYDIVSPFELDFVIPDKKIAIEVNDTWSHCIEHLIKNRKFSQGKAKNYHNLKSELCVKNGFRLIHVFEKDMSDLDSILSVLLPTKKLNARDLEYRHGVFVKDFIIENHKQHTCLKNYGGAIINDNNEIIGAITFKKNKNELELDKLCFKKGYNVRGGASKLFKNYLKNINVNNYKSIITFCDTTYHSGKVYEKLGFSLDKIGSPSYYWVNLKTNEWVHRRKFQKHLLVKKYCPWVKKNSEEYNNLKEKKIAQENGYVRIYTCNQNKYKYIF